VPQLLIVVFSFNVVFTYSFLPRDGEAKSTKKELYGEDQEDQGFTVVQSGQWKLFYRDIRNYPQ
jgi:hypothetical protein